MNRLTSLLLSIVLSGLSVTAFGQTSAKSTSSSKPASTNGGTALPSEATVNSFLKQMFGWNQELSWRIAEIKPSEAPGIAQVAVVFSTPKGEQVTRIYITPDEKYAFTGELVPFGADPFAKTRADLSTANGPVKGPKDAVVTIVEFGDLECPACKAAQPNVMRLMQEEPKVKLIFQNYPLETIHKWALIAAKYVDCLARANNDVALKFIDTVYEHQSEVNEQNVDQMLKGYVKQVGGNPDEIAACVAKPETEKRVKDSEALGEKLDVSSTPTFFINGRRIVGFASSGAPYDAVKQMVDYDVANPGH